MQRVSLSYHHTPVVSEVSLQVVPGELRGLIGPNGCGKSSLIKALSRVMALHSGQIKLNGRDIHAFSRSQLAKLVGVVPQNPLMPETFTVAEVVLLGRTPHLGLLGHESAHDLKTVSWAMERTGISSLASRKMGELSGGERQRVTIARVLAQEPNAILLDEPTANLDINHQKAILDLIKGLCKERNLAVLIALHDLNLATQYCDKLVMLKNGHLFTEGTPRQVITTANIQAVYGTNSLVYPHPENTLPVVLVSNKDDNSSTSGRESER